VMVIWAPAAAHRSRQQHTDRVDFETGIGPPLGLSVLAKITCPVKPGVKPAATRGSLRLDQWAGGGL
jgi:hypothetical protein